MLGGRPAGMVLLNALRPANYAALVRMARSCEQPLDSGRRYFTRAGEYPWCCPVRTPLGTVAPKLYSPHDMLTVNEVFFREDYRCEADVRAVVDIGSNIGISGLYFLTRNSATRVWLYEPVPANVERLLDNLSGYESRYELTKAAVADVDGELPFGVEPFGRYGGLDIEGRERIQVRVHHVNDVLAEVLETAGFIDVLKLDTEGSEVRTVEAIDPDLLRRVGVVYLEVERPGELELPGFTSSWSCETLRLANRTALAQQ